MSTSHSRGRRFLLLTIVLALAASAGWFAWMFSRASAEGVLAQGAPDGARREESATLEAAAAQEGDRAQAHADEAAQASAAALPSTASAAEVADGVDVLVVTRGGQKPVAGAIVRCAPAAEDEDESAAQSWLRSGDLDARLEADGKTYVADEQGHARVPRFANGAILAASQGNSWGQTYLTRRPDPPVRIEVVPDGDLRAQVVDGSGAFVGGVRVALRSRNSDWSQDVALATSRAEDGLAIVRHAGYMRRGQGGGTERWAVALAALLDPPVEVEIDRTTFPDEPVRLVLPATGEVEVRIVDDDGELWQGACNVDLRDLSPSERSSERNGSGGRAGVILEGVRGGVALFPHVSPGREIGVWVHRDTSDARNSARGRGPAAAGQRAVITVNLGKEAPILAGRLVDAQGAPLVRRRIGLMISPGNDERQIEQYVATKSNELGRFEVDLEPYQRDDVVRSLIVVEHLDSGDALSSATSALPASLERGRTDLGDLTMEPLSVLVAGIVLDVDGTPVAGASVRAGTKESYGDPTQYGWQPMWWTRAISGADGRFELRGRTKDKEVALQVQKQGKSGVPLVVAVPAKDVELRLEAAGEVAGRVQIDATIPTSYVQLTFRRSGVDESHGFDPSIRSRAVIGDDGSFLVRNLRAGSYEVQISVRNSSKRPPSVRDVVVEAGATTRDPRLDPIDLRSFVRGLRLRFLDDAGEKIAEGSVRSKSMGAAEGAETRYTGFRNGEMLLVTDGGAVDLEITARGFFVHRMANVSTDQDVILERAPQIELALAEGLRPPEKPFRLKAAVQSELLGPKSRWTEANFDANGRAKLFPPSAGRLRVQLRIAQNRGNEGEVSETFDDGVARILDVRPTGEQTFEIWFDQAKLEDALKALSESGG